MRVVGKHCVIRVYEEAEDVVVVHDDEGEGMLNTVSSVTTRHGKNVRKHVFLNTYFVIKHQFLTAASCLQRVQGLMWEVLIQEIVLELDQDPGE